jgi:D-alanyl-D-alanine dipeptidase
MKRHSPAIARIAVVSLFALAFGACTSSGPEGGAHPIDPTAHARQLVLVRSADWDSLTGTLVWYERARRGDAWTQIGAPAEINFGRAGLAWGAGLHGGTLDVGPEKHEGDGRSPAGVFRLSAVYGYAPRDSVRYLMMPYIELSSTCQCVDDVRSAYYNLVIDSLSVPQADWTSRERMRPPTGEWNKWGVIVDHNMSPRVPGRGSCIFLHVIEGRGVPTSGCTSIEEDRIADLVRWLDAAKDPILVQLPQQQHLQRKSHWRLP